MNEDHENTEIPKKGDVVKLKSGILTKVLSVRGTDRWGQVEVMLHGCRGFVQISELELLNVLDRMVMEI